jgi:hypothetical protein
VVPGNSDFVYTLAVEPHAAWSKYSRDSPAAVVVYDERSAMRDRFPWARLLAFVTGLVNQELLLRNEYLAAREPHP